MNINLLGAYQKIITILLLIIVGFVMKKKRVITNEAQAGFTQLLVKVAIPCVVFHSFMEKFDWSKFHTAVNITIIAFIAYPLMQFVVAKILYLRYGKDEEKQNIFTFATTYPNTVFMGFPFIQALFGASGLFYAAVFNLPYNLYMWSFGFAKLTKQRMNKDGLKHTLTNPVFLSCIVGYIWWSVNGFVPEHVMKSLTPVWDVITAISNVNTPISMILIGAMLADSKIGEIISDKDVWYYSFNKLILAPALMLTVLYLIGFRGWTLAIPAVVMAMPTCATCAIIAGQYEVRKEFTSSIVTFSTALSAITASAWVFVIAKLM